MVTSLDNLEAAEDIAAWLGLVVEPGDVIELRALNCGSDSRFRHTVSGYFDSDHLDELVKAAMTWTPQAEGVYTTINPVNPALLARAANRVISRPRNTTADTDIVRRVGLVFDADPVRPAGISATEKEKALARELIDRLVMDLAARGWPEPILSDSGNGYHARFRVALPADDSGLVERVLKAADVMHSTKLVKIDTSLSNASRIIKLPGTMSRKGDSVPTLDRVHRWARVLSIPDDFQVVPVELLEALAAEADEPAVVQAVKPPGRCSVCGPGPGPSSRPSPAARARAYVFASEFPCSVAGQRGHRQLYRVAAILVDGFGLTFDLAWPIFRDWNASKAQPPESERHLRHTLDDALKRNPVPSRKLLLADRSS